MNIMFIGIDLYPHHTPSDKNYWLAILNEIKSKYQNIQIISFVKRKPTNRVEKYDNIVFNYFKFLPYLNPYHPITGLIARFMVFLLNIAIIQEKIRRQDIKIIHFIDNLGIVIPLMKKLNAEKKVILSLSTSRTQHKLNNIILKICCSKLDSLVVFTKTLKNRLIEIGIDVKNIDVIRWGVKIIPENKRDRQTPNEIIILWTGFLTQVWEEDLHLAIKIANYVLQHTDKCKFIFCFKPHSYNEKFKKYQDVRIEIQPQSSSFADITRRAQIYFCPIKNKNKIIAPPLTWIEMMSSGMPIITTSVKGADEIISNGKSGYICEDEERMVESILFLINNRDDYKRMSQNARRSIRRNFNFDVSCRKYIEVWGNMHGQA